MTSAPDPKAEREAAKEALLSAAERAARSGELGAGLAPALARHVDSLVYEDLACAAAASGAQLACVRDAEGAVQWAVAQAHFASSSGNVGREMRRLAAAWALRKERLRVPLHVAQDRLESELERLTLALYGRVMALDEAGAPALSDGSALPIDGRLVEALASVGGPAAREAAAMTRDKSVERVRAFLRGGDPRSLVGAWSRHDEALAPRFLVALAKVAWLDVVRPSLEARPLGPATVMGGEDRFAIVGAHVERMAWAMGGGGLAVDVNGDRYACAEGSPARALLPNSHALLPGRGPAQSVLPLDTGAEPLGVVVAKSAGWVLSMLASKAAALFFSHAHLFEDPSERIWFTLGDLAKALHPAVTRLQPREIKATALAFRELTTLGVHFPDSSRALVFRSRDVDLSASPDAGTLLGIGLNDFFLDELNKTKARFSAYRQSFLYNLDGVLRLPNNAPSLLRLYLLFAHDWNGMFDTSPQNWGRFDPKRLKPMKAPDLATRANLLSLTTVQYLAEKRAGHRPASVAASAADRRKEASKQIAALGDRLHELQTKGLVVFKEAGPGEFLVPPPDSYLEAQEVHLRRRRHKQAGEAE